MILGAVVALSSSLLAQTNLIKVDYQWADSLNGPWTKPPGHQAYVQPDGSLLTLAADPQKHFRLTIQEVDLEGGESPAVPVAQLRSKTYDIAWNHLQWLLAAQMNEPGSEGSWSNASLAPIAYKVFDPAFKNGEEPAYIEFKIVSDFQPSAKRAEFLVGNEVAPMRDLGHILVALNEGDAPVPEFSEEGPTPCEHLLRRVGHVPHLKIMRFGPTFAAVENAKGELLANAGADPFKIPEDFLRYKDQTFKGEFDSETAEEAPRDGYGGPKLAAAPYESYADFKADYLRNPVYQELRNRKALRVAAEWALLNGVTPPAPAMLQVNVGKSIHVLSEQSILRYFLDDDEGEGQPLARISVPASGGGLLITGARGGAAPLTVKTAAGVQHFELIVLSGDVSAQSFTPGWQTPSTWSVAGGYSATPRYHQTSHPDWCPKVGCGPVAWAILLGHWDRERNVPAAFYRNIPGDLTISDAPFKVADKPTHMRNVYNLLHDYCDVICNPFGSAGATPPGDMVEAGATYLWFPKILGYLGYSYSWAWDLTDPDWNEPSNRIRTSVKNGRPAIVGLGWLWHYGVAYKYRYQEFKVTPDTVLLRRRWFAVNEGWGKDQGAWYSGYDTFLGASIKPWQKIH